MCMGNNDSVDGNNDNQNDLYGNNDNVDGNNDN